MRDAGELVGCCVADTISGCLDGVHFNAGEISQDIRDAFQGWPVVLDVLTRGEVGIAAIIFTGNGCKHPQLTRA